MPRIKIEGEPLLNIGTHAKRGPARRDHLPDTALIRRTVSRVPEVMVKVLSKDSNRLRSVARHLAYIGRYGDLELETDDGERLQGKDVGKQLVEDWDLDLEPTSRRAPKLVHKIMLSMPAGTPPQGVLDAARNFAREEFALSHRYVLALHTDEPHVHVHLVVKAVSEQGVRLNIQKATLREWRRQFARHLREQGIAANATERAVRGQTRIHKKDGIYRAGLRGDSTHLRARAEAVAGELSRGRLQVETGKATLIETRRTVEQGWRAMSEILVAQGQSELAAQVKRFVEHLPPPRTEKEQIASALRVREPRVR